MVQVSFPGVYVVEVPSGVHTITGVATSIAAFLGRATKGPMNRAMRLLSQADYVRTFGAPHPLSDLAQSVRMFFDNGGTDCYVIRIAKNAKKAKVTLRSLSGTNVLDFTAKADGVWANTVRLEVDYDTLNPDESFNLRVIQEEGGLPVAVETFGGLSMNPASPRFPPAFVTQSSGLVEVTLNAAIASGPGSITNPANSFDGFSQARRPLGAAAADVQALLSTLLGTAPAKTKFDISVDGSPDVPVDLAGWVVPATGALIESELAGRINAFLAALSPALKVRCALLSVPSVGNLLRITSDTSDKISVRVRRAASNDLAAALMLGVDQGGIEPTRYSNFRPAPTATMLTLGDPTTPAAAINAITGLAQTDIDKITLEGVDVPLNVAPNSLVTVTTPGVHRWYENAAGASPVTGDNDGVREKLRIIAAAINANGTLKWSAKVWGYHLAILAKNGNPNDQPATLTTATSGTLGTNLTRNVRQYSLGTAGTGAFSTGGTDGDDGVAPGLAEYVGDPVLQTGFHALDAVDLFNLMVLPTDTEVGATTQLDLWGAASTYCGARRAFLLIDAPTDWTDLARPDNPRPAIVQDTTKLTSTLRPLILKENAAIFYPRLAYRDGGGVVRKIGPAGPIAGLMARIDSSRGVWKAPAGIEADLRGLLDLEVNLTDPENGVLNKLGVNAIRKFPNGFVSWGARTAAGFDDNTSTDWKYVPIRRFALFLEESLYRGTKWVVFEPNDEPLWAKIRMNLNAFMMSLFRQGAFQGTTPDKAFYVKCDAETTTQNDRNLGIVNIEVGFAPLKPAEFVIIRIQQIAGDL